MFFKFTFVTAPSHLFKIPSTLMDPHQNQDFQVGALLPEIRRKFLTFHPFSFIHIGLRGDDHER